MSDLRTLNKSAVWAALAKARDFVQDETIPLHRYENPIQGALAQEYARGFKQGNERLFAVVETWLQELDGLREAKAKEQKALHEQATKRSE
jgi:hypothetical protein